MNTTDKKLAFAQFIKFILDSRNLINMINQNLLEKYPDRVNKLTSDIKVILDKYYHNFNICEDCGHPIPILPSKTDVNALFEICDDYVELYELKTGDSLEDLFVIDTKVVEPVIKENPKKILLPDKFKSDAKKFDETIRIKGTLTKIGK